jgi:hypothetical protein
LGKLPQIYIYGIILSIFKLPISLPNIQTFLTIYKFFENNVTGIFAQGYADIPGDFTETISFS